VQPRIDITHPFVGDLNILVQTPNTAFGQLVSRPLGGTGSCAADNILATFQDGAPPFACSGTPPANGTDPVAPAASLVYLAQFARTGTWRLQLEDDAAGNVGTLNGWSLTFVCSPLNVVSVTATDPTGNEAGDPIVFTVTRTGVTSLPLNIHFTFTGTATNLVDYVALATTIPAGQASTTMTITPTADALAEPTETVIATIAPSPEYVVGAPSSATGTIVDASAVPALSPLALAVCVFLLAMAALLALRR
jgi:subtilisin-like proprotein convertase family protein